jgi:hypothetical protein
LLPQLGQGDIQWVLLSNYMYSFPWLLEACPALLTAPKARGEGTACERACALTPLPQVFMLTDAKQVAAIQYVRGRANFEARAREQLRGARTCAARARKRPPASAA